MEQKNSYEKIYDIVKQIPRGRLQPMDRWQRLRAQKVGQGGRLCAACKSGSGGNPVLPGSKP